jgi:hypothetical protein
MKKAKSQSKVPVAKQVKVVLVTEHVMKQMRAGVMALGQPPEKEPPPPG